MKSVYLNIARQFLNDNNVDCLQIENNSMTKLAEELPFKLSDVIEDKKERSDLKQ